MSVKEAIQQRRAYRSLEKVEITEDLIDELAKYISLAPSCFNNQPWRFVFVYEEETLKKMYSTLTRGNYWATDSSMIIAVFSKKELDCIQENREYYLFDTGMATAYLILILTEMGFVAHPVAGYDENKTKEILGIPNEMTVITLIIVGKKASTISSKLEAWQIEREKTRPDRLPIDKFAFKNNYK